MSKILVISGHPNLPHSVANATILNELKAHFGANVEVRSLGDLYPSYAFDVAAEQAALTSADIIVFQTPIYWYSIPAILKKWMDDILLYGFAYGEGGTALQGKKFIMSVTTGGQAEPYQNGTVSTIAELMAPFRSSATFTGMQWMEQVYTHGLLTLPGLSTDEDIKRVQGEAKAHAQRIIQRIGQA